MSRKKPGYTARDKSVQKMTRDGLVEKNLVTDEVSRVSSRTGEQEFRHHTGISGELHHLSPSGQEEFRSVHAGVSSEKSRRPGSRSPSRDPSGPAPAFPPDQPSFSTEPATSVQTAEHSPDRDTVFHSQAASDYYMEETPSVRPSSAGGCRYPSSCLAGHPQTGSPANDPIPENRHNALQTHSGENMFLHHREDGTYGEHDSPYRQIPASVQEASSTGRSQPDHYRHHPASYRNHPAGTSSASDSRLQEEPSGSPYLLPTEQPPDSPYLYEEHVPPDQQKPDSHSPETLPASDMAPGSSPFYPESGRQNPFTESPHPAVPPSSAGSFAAAVMEQSHLSRHRQETGHSARREGGSRNRAQETRREPFPSGRETPEEKQESPDSAPSPKDNGVVINHRRDHTQKEPASVTAGTPDMENPAGHRLQESHPANPFSEENPKKRFQTERGADLRTEQPDAPAIGKPGSARTAPRSSPARINISSAAPSGSAPKNNGIPPDHRMEKTEPTRSGKQADLTRGKRKSAAVSEKQSSLQGSARKKQIRQTCREQRKKPDPGPPGKTDPWVSAKQAETSVSGSPGVKKSARLRAEAEPSRLKEKPPHSEALHPGIDGPVFTADPEAHRKKTEKQKKKPRSRLQEGDPKQVKSGSRLRPEKGDVKGKPQMAGTIRKGAGKAAATAAGAAAICLREKFQEAGEENTGIEAAKRTEYLLGQGVRSVNRRAKSVTAKNRERKKTSRLRESPLEDQPVFRTGDISRKKQDPEKKNPLNRFFQKQRNKRKAGEAVQKGRKAAGKTAQKGTEAAASITERAASVVRVFVQKNKTAVCSIIAILLFIILLISQLQACSAIVTQTLGSVSATSWPADDQEITKAELYYSRLEADLQKKIDTVETTYPGYDEYNYNIGEIGHDPVALISYLCARYGDFTFNDTIRQELNTIFNKQYSYTVKTEKETRTVTKTVKAGDSLGTVVTSGYCSCSICCGQGSGGLTASGTSPSSNHTIAVDASSPIVPMGTQIIMNGVLYTVEDTGNLNTHGVDFDVYYDSHSEALAHGHRSYEAYYAGGDGEEIEVTTTETVTVCYVTMTSSGLDSVLSSRMDDDQEALYNLYVQSRGNRQFLGSPVSGYWYSYISSHYGYRTTNGVTELHNGLDITPAAGTEILSVQDGTVSGVGSNSTYGNYIIIQNDKGYKTLYAHCASVSVSKGQAVSTGDVIGRAGSTGNVSTATLHIEFQYENEYYNPYFYLSCEGSALSGSAGTATGDAATLIQEAQKYLGTPYVWGGYSPSGFDCSGFVSYCLTNSGVRNTGHLTANGLLDICTKVSKDQLQPGDLVFFQGTYNTSGASHVGIYIGSGEYGSGTFIHCGDPCKYGDLNSSYWTQHWLTGGRWY